MFTFASTAAAIAAATGFLITAASPASPPVSPAAHYSPALTHALRSVSAWSAAPTPMMSTAPDPQDSDNVKGSCLYTGPLNHQLCVDDTKFLCIRNILPFVVTGRFYPGQSCADLKAEGIWNADTE